MFLADLGLLDDRSRVLGVGAGDERILFWLANHVGRGGGHRHLRRGRLRRPRGGRVDAGDPAVARPVPLPRGPARRCAGWTRASSPSTTRASMSSTRCPRSSTSAGPGRWTGRRGRSPACCGREEWRCSAPTCWCAGTRSTRRRWTWPPGPVSLGRKRRTAGPRHRSVVAEGFTPRELRRHVIEASGLRADAAAGPDASRPSPGTTCAASTPTAARSRRAAPSSPTCWCRSTARCSRRCACRCGEAGRH